MKTVTRRAFAGGIALLPPLRFSAASAQAGVTPAEARAIAKEAYIYGEPIVDNYRIQHAYFVDRAGPEHKTSWIWNSSREIIFATFPGADAEVIGDRWLDDLGLEAPVSDLCGLGARPERRRRQGKTQRRGRTHAWG